MAEKKQKFVIIDGNALIHRAFHAIPPLTTKNGQLVNAAYGFTSILLKVLKDFKPSHIAVTYDVKKKTFRHKLYQEYKAKRIKQPQELYDQIPITKEIVKTLNIPIYELEGYEADDIIGTLTEKRDVDLPNVETIIVTGDLDALQLVDANTKVFTMRRGFSDTLTYDIQTVKEKYGLNPNQIVDLKALAGDQSDNIPGVKGIGQQTGTKLLQTFGTLENIYQSLKKDDDKFSKFKPRALNLLKEYESDARLSKKLATILKDVPIKFVLKETMRGKFDRDAAVALFQDLEFKSLLTKLPEEASQSSFSLKSMSDVQKPKSRTPGYTLIKNEIDLKKFIAEANKQTEMAVDTETTSLDTLSCDLLGISFCWRAGQAYYADLSPGSSLRKNGLRALKPLLENKKIFKYGHNLKFDIAVLHQAGIALEPISFDTMIASYLSNPATRQHNLDALVFTELGHEMIPIEQLIGKKGKNQLPMDRVPVEDLAEYSCEDVDFTFQLVQPLKKQLESKSISGLMNKIELPLVKALWSMEKQGVLIDSNFLSRMSHEAGKKIAQLEKGIYKDRKSVV